MISQISTEALNLSLNIFQNKKIFKNLQKCQKSLKVLKILKVSKNLDCYQQVKIYSRDQQWQSIIVSNSQERINILKTFKILFLKSSIHRYTCFCLVEASKPNFLSTPVFCITQLMITKLKVETIYKKTHFFFLLDSFIMNFCSSLVYKTRKVFSIYITIWLYDKINFLMQKKIKLEILYFFALSKEKIS